jgi:hypothetical protein
MHPRVTLDRPMSDLAVTQSDYIDIRRRSMRNRILMRLLALGLPAASFTIGYFYSLGRNHPVISGYPLFIGGAAVSAPFGYRRRLTFIGVAIVSIAVFLMGVYLGQSRPPNEGNVTLYSVFRR